MKLKIKEKREVVF